MSITYIKTTKRQKYTLRKNKKCFIPISEEVHAAVTEYAKIHEYSLVEAMYYLLRKAIASEFKLRVFEGGSNGRPTKR